MGWIHHPVVALLTPGAEFGVLGGSKPFYIWHYRWILPKQLSDRRFSLEPPPFLDFSVQSSLSAGSRSADLVFSR